MLPLAKSRVIIMQGLVASFGTLIAATLHAASPVVDVTLTCNNDGTLTVEVHATDSDWDMTYIGAHLHRYSSEQDCINQQNPEESVQILDEHFPQGHGNCTVSTTRDCNLNKWYHATAFAEDELGNGSGTMTTGCCQCQETTFLFPALSEWGTVTLILLVLAVATLVFLRRRNLQT